MKVEQVSLNNASWKKDLKGLNRKAGLLLIFMSPSFLPKKEFLTKVREQWPNAIITGCSTAGEISDIYVNDHSVSLTVIEFEKTTCKKVSVKIKGMDCSYHAGKELASQLKTDDLRHILVLSDGLNVNGADLVSGLNSELADNVCISGGLAADGSDFKKTFLIDDGSMEDKLIIGVGLYGKGLKVGCSSKGGWDSFGIERKVTKSKKNVLYELDGKPALELYKSFLGEEAKNLPSSGLMFPLSLREHETSPPVVRTILAVDEEDQSLTFAGNIPENSYVRLMKANIDRLILGAQHSAHDVAKTMDSKNSELAILISCVGRRLVLKQLIEEEIEVVRETLGPKPVITGFYSYGEIAPFKEFSACELHNQTMTITNLSE
ncbi:FIST N-terminal domain-containing protein [Gramella sp. AN32]|uniref:FIST signal transduction protein n=1 Tax=Christiangramia antarctica TaxID=2058158 RepID=A0ABW5X587_9FLAO|nr:FIST N-terminal domain-containing protein [Gramella sp. AN32]MCM4154661.1 hypothetical protein [Gramella sp. AN32]